MGELRAWRRRGTRTLYRSAHVEVREDALELPDGREKVYPVMALGSSVGILPFLPDDRVILVRQYRHITRDFSWEIPGGGILPGEGPPAAPISILKILSMCNPLFRPHILRMLRLYLIPQNWTPKVIIVDDIRRSNLFTSLSPKRSSRITIGNAQVVFSRLISRFGRCTR